MPLHQAAILHHNEIIEAQIEAERNARACRKLINEANSKCDLLESNNFQTRMKTTINDIEPICYGININQGDSTRSESPD